MYSLYFVCTVCCCFGKTKKQNNWSSKITASTSDQLLILGKCWSLPVKYWKLLVNANPGRHTPWVNTITQSTKIRMPMHAAKCRGISLMFSVSDTHGQNITTTHIMHEHTLSLSHTHTHTHTHTHKHTHTNEAGKHTQRDDAWLNTHTKHACIHTLRLKQLCTHT